MQGKQAWVAAAIALGLALVIWAAYVALRGTPSPEFSEPSDQRFRCGYAAERSGVQDPDCADIARPRPPPGVTIEIERDAIDPEA